MVVLRLEVAVCMGALHLEGVRLLLVEVDYMVVPRLAEEV
jgi:hypothetical protein